jgi:hypothetical protein
MTGTEIAAYARILTNTDSVTLTDADILTILNVKYGHRILDILRIQVDKNANMEESYTNLVSSTGLVAGDNGYNGEYAFPTNLLKPIRAEVLYTTTGTPVKCSIYDITDSQTSEQAGKVNYNFSQSDPYVRFERDSFFVRPIPTTSVTAGLRIWYEKRQTAFSALSDTPTFEQNLHDILSVDIAEIESLRHPENFTIEWRTAFALIKSETDGRFKEFYKNRMKRNKQLRAKGESYA